MKSNIWSRVTSDRINGEETREEGCEKNGMSGGRKRRSPCRVRKRGRQGERGWEASGKTDRGEGEVGIAIKAICCIVPAIRRRQLSPTVLTSSQGLSAAVEHVCFIDLAPLRALPSNVPTKTTLPLRETLRTAQVRKSRMLILIVILTKPRLVVARNFFPPTSCLYE